MARSVGSVSRGKWEDNRSMEQNRSPDADPRKYVLLILDKDAKAGQRKRGGLFSSWSGALLLSRSDLHSAGCRVSVRVPTQGHMRAEQDGASSGAARGCRHPSAGGAEARPV